jgi:hypothetical protein
VVRTRHRGSLQYSEQGSEVLYAMFDLCWLEIPKLQKLEDVDVGKEELGSEGEKGGINRLPE